jgi:hypothetical protein
MGVNGGKCGLYIIGTVTYDSDTVADYLIIGMSHHLYYQCYVILHYVIARDQMHFLCLKSLLFHWKI